MFENFGMFLSTSTIHDDLERMENLDYDYVYGVNAPVQDYAGLVMDIGRNAAALREKINQFSFWREYPEHRYATDSSNYRSFCGWRDTVLTMFNASRLADKMRDQQYLEGDFGDENDTDLRQCIKAASDLSKKQMLELIPGLCQLVQSFMDTRAAFETVDEFLKEVYEQNKALEQKGGFN